MNASWVQKVWIGPIGSRESFRHENNIHTYEYDRMFFFLGFQWILNSSTWGMLYIIGSLQRLLIDICDHQI